MKEFYPIFLSYGLMYGRMISGSKSGYRQKFTENDVVFNANIILENYGKIWYGDLDLTLDAEKLNKIANELGQTIYVLREMDGRFEHENDPIETFINKAVSARRAHW